MRRAVAALLLLGLAAVAQASAQSDMPFSEEAARDALARAAAADAGRSGSSGQPDMRTSNIPVQSTPQNLQFNPQAAAAHAASTSSTSARPTTSTHSSTGVSYLPRGTTSFARRVEAPALPLRGAIGHEPRNEALLAAQDMGLRTDNPIKVRGYKPPFQLADTSSLAAEAAVAAARIRQRAPSFEELN